MVSVKLSPGKLTPRKFPSRKFPPGELPSGKFPPRKFSPGIILPMLLDVLFFALLSPLSLIFLQRKLKLNLLRCIKKYFAACLPFRKCFGYDENVLLILIKEMFNFTKIRRHQKELSIESEKTCEESFYMLKTTFL